VPFIRGGLEAGEPVLVVESSEMIELLRTAFDRDVDKVLFADMAEIGANPARIIPAWHDFVARHSAGGYWSGLVPGRDSMEAEEGAVGLVLRLACLAIATGLRHEATEARLAPPGLRSWMKIKTLLTNSAGTYIVTITQLKPRPCVNTL
jgi:MEDS: MEthanogen/methylotroph, DcmR Sensory domain